MFLLLSAYFVCTTAGYIKTTIKFIKYRVLMLTTDSVTNIEQICHESSRILSKEYLTSFERKSHDEIERHLKLGDDLLSGAFKSEIDSLYEGFPQLSTQYRVLDRVGEGMPV